MTDEPTYYEQCATRLWAIESSISINKHCRDVDKIIAGAQKISQFIERRSDAEVTLIHEKKKQ